MHLLVLPVSGNFFPCQLGLLTQLIDAEYDPNLIMGTSGGAVSAILSLGADWSPSGIRRLARKLKSSLFLRSWWPKPLSILPSWGLGFFRGSVYNSGEGLDEFFETYFSVDSITQKEVWIGVTGITNKNKKKESAQFFCNLSQEKSQIDISCFEKYHNIGQSTLCNSLHFLDGDLKRIQEATIASASIPTVVPPQKIGEDSYVDGGVFFASPMTPMRDSLEALEDEEGLHITYVNTYDIEEQKIMSSIDFYPGIFHTGAMTFATMVYSILSQDRLNGLKILNPDISKIHRIPLKGSKTTLEQIFAFRKKCKRSFLELYTKSLDKIDLTDFKPEDILNVMDKVQEEYYCRFWWIGDNKFKLSL